MHTSFVEDSLGSVVDWVLSKISNGLMLAHLDGWPARRFSL